MKRIIAMMGPIVVLSTHGANSVAQEQAAGLEEVVVTATRRSESVENVPISIKALSQSDLTDNGIKGIADIAAVTPGLQFATPNSFASSINTITIRGLNSNAGPSPVGLYLDDTPIQSRLNFISNIGNAFPMVFDLNRVEVARGPQGTLFGAGAEAGTVRFITNEPSLTNFSGYTHSEVATTQGGDPSYEIGAAAGGPIVEDSLGFRVSAWIREDGGYVDRLDPLTLTLAERNENKDVKQAFRAALAYKVSDVKITSSMYYQNYRTDGTPFYEGNFSDASQGQFATAAFLPETTTDSIALPSVKVEAPLSFADLTSTTSFFHRNDVVYSDESGWFGANIGGFGSPLGAGFPVSAADVTPSYYALKVAAVTQEVRLASNQPQAFVTWVAGLYFDHRTQEDIQSNSSPSVAGSTIFDAQQHTTDRQIAAYAQTDFHLTDKFTATLGERIASVKVSGVNYIGPGLFDGGLPPVSSTGSKETPSTPKFGLSYQIDSDNLVYVSAAEGFRIGGGNVPVPTSCGATAPSTYKSDHLWSYEIGAKDTFFNDRLQIDTSVFHVNWSQIQQIVYLANCSQGYIGNAGDAISNGFDLAIRTRMTEQLRFDVDVGYANAYFNSNVAAGNGTPLVQAGDKIGFLPQVNAPWNINTTANYEVPLSGTDSVRFRGQYQYNSRNPGPFVTQIPTSISYFPALVANPPTHLTNMSVGWKRDKLDLSFYVNNVFNSHPLLSKFTVTPTTNLIDYTTFRPRTVGMAANLGF